MEAYQEISLLKSSALRQLSAFLCEHRQAWANHLPDLETVELPLGIAASEFGANSCRVFLPIVLKNS